MGRMAGFVSLIIVAAIGLYLYNRQATSMPGAATPKSTVDQVAVRNDLLAIANAERVYWVSNSKYGSLDDLRNSGGFHIPIRPDYSYSAVTSETGFRIVASYSGADPKAPRSLSIDETMALHTE